MNDENICLNLLIFIKYITYFYFKHGIKYPSSKKKMLGI